jgi:uncharacterized protein YdcH (DUF465 family)
VRRKLLERGLCRVLASAHVEQPPHQEVAEMTIPEIREQLLHTDSEFQKLAEEHSRYSTLLNELARSPYLNAEDLNLEAELKKAKLRLKDEMEKRMSQFRQAS